MNVIGFQPLTPAVPVWLKRSLMTVAVLFIAMQWLNTRIAILRVNQFGPSPVMLATYPIYHSMATGFREGRVGQVDLAALRRPANINNPWAPYERVPPGEPHQWVNYYTLDIGYSFIVEMARLAFPTLPDNHLRALALQLVADAALVGFVYFLFSQWSVGLGLLAAYLYASNGIFYDLVSFAFYYYWDIPLTLVILGSLLLAYRRPNQAGAWLMLGAALLGFGVWLRGSWWPIAFFLFSLVALTPALRRKGLAPLLVFALIASPQVIRASVVRGHPALSTRTMWHVALVGLGYYPNPYGLQASDGVIFKLTKDKYGVEFRSEDYAVHDEAARKEYFSIWRKDPRFVIRSFLGRLRESATGSTNTSVLSFLFVSNLTYRILCLISFVAMLIRGGERRLLAIAAAGTFIIYVGLTSAIYFVGLAYDSVSQVTLFILFMGGIDAALSAVRSLAPLIADALPIATRRSASTTA